ncbi:MAG: sigma-70 family RNA polymerase sigma factor [bacterium]|nr:sigma-70 family RNA polymerase sigma factor [bacterium]
MSQNQNSNEVTQLLRAWSDGNEDALDELWPLVYADLKALAGSFMRNERPDHTLQATALVNEAYLRLVDQDSVTWKDRGHFFAIAAKMMRRILVDHARRRASQKRNGDVVPIENDSTFMKSDGADLVAIDEALSSFETVDPERAKVVELRFFAGLTNDETARVLECSEKTVRRHWQVARLWLYREIKGEQVNAG